jgi:ATP-binding cassette, subfamily C, bacterial LapB
MKTDVPAQPTRLREDLIHPDPLLDSLVELCRLHGRSASRASLSGGLPLVAGRLTLELAERAAARAGMATRLQRVTLDGIDPAALPAILVLADNQSCVLVGWADDGSARVLLPQTGQGEITLARANLAERYSGITLFVRPQFRFDSRTREVRATKRGHWFWSAVSAQRFV